MARGKTDLDNYEYDNWLSKNGKTSEMRKRTKERRGCHKEDGRGFHFGIDDKPVKCDSAKDFDKALADRGLMRGSDVDKKLR